MGFPVSLAKLSASNQYIKCFLFFSAFFLAIFEINIFTGIIKSFI